jgi:iron complex outermembrane recepter protein
MKIVIFFTCFSLSYLLTGAGARAQGSVTFVTGRVQRAANSEPLVGASVFIKGTNRGTITGPNGRYRLSISGPGVLVVRFLGFLDVEQPVTTQDRQLTVNARMVSSDQQLADLMVTANRVEEYLQQVPVAASVIGHRDLEKRSVYNTLEALNSTPNLITDSWLSSQVSFSIRGLSTTFDNVGFESTVALYIDDVYFSRSFGFNSTLLDIERVEVLRGPQGTLFGKNTIGGVIHVISEQPEMANNGQIELTYGNYNFGQVRAKLNRELIPNKLALRVVGAFTRRDGYIQDATPAVQAVNQTNFFGFRSALLYTPNPRLRLTLRGNYGRDTDAENTFVYASKPDRDPLDIPADAGLNTVQNVPNTFGREQYGGLAKADIQVGRNTLTSISALNRSTDDYFGDNDVARADATRWGRTQSLQTLSQEIRLTSPREQRLAFVAGLYGLTEQIGAVDTFTVNRDFGPVAAELLNAPVAAGFENEGYTTRSTIDSRSVAAFGSVTYALTDAFRLNAGLRLTAETRTLNYLQRVRQQLTPAGLPYDLIGIYAVDVSDGGQPLRRTAQNLAPSWDAGLNYQFTPFSMGYAKYVRGFKGAGFNTSVTVDPTGAGLVFRPEYVDSYEIGLKTKFNDRTRLNAAVFYTDYRDKQELLDQGTRVRVANAEKTRGWGAEVELAAMLKGVRIDASVGVLNLTYIDFPFGTDDAGQPVNYGGNRLLKAPDLTVSLAPEWATNLTDRLRLFVGMNINYTGKAYNDISNSDLIARQAVTIYNGRISLAPRNGKWSAALWGKNLSDTRYIQHGWEYDFGNQIAWSRPRYFGAELYLNF